MSTDLATECIAAIRPILRHYSKQVAEYEINAADVPFDSPNRIDNFERALRMLVTHIAEDGRYDRALCWGIAASDNKPRRLAA